MKLNIGCGNTFYGDVRLDIDKNCRGKNIIGDAHHLPFQNDVFDSVIAFAVLEHLKNPIIGVSECFRVCKEGGIVKLSFPCNSLLYSDILSHLMNGRLDLMVKQRLAFKRGAHKWQLNIDFMVRLLLRFGSNVECYKPSYRFIYGKKGELFKRFVRFPAWFVLVQKRPPLFY